MKPQRHAGPAEANEREMRAQWAEQVSELAQGQPKADVRDASPLQKPAREWASRLECEFSALGSAQAARALAGQGKAPATLVFCSAKRPGGGWRGGAAAQEEQISLVSSWGVQAEESQGFYDRSVDWMGPHKAIAARGVWLAERPGEWLDDELSAVFVGVSAPNLAWARESSQKVIPQKIQEALAQRLALALEMAADAGCDALVGGLIGCGVFGWDVADCGKAWSMALGGARRTPRLVHFACPGRPEAREALARAIGAKIEMEASPSGPAARAVAPRSPR
jgi:uncharacterized protein (TIGR02452 family)